MHSSFTRVLLVRERALHEGRVRGLHTSVFLFRAPRLALLPDVRLGYEGFKLGDAEFARVSGKSGRCSSC